MKIRNYVKHAKNSVNLKFNNIFELFDSVH